MQYSAFHKAWRLRYAGLDEVDLYGGTVTLTEDSPLTGLKDGQYVHIEGRLVDVGCRAISPPYEASSIKVIE